MSLSAQKCCVPGCMESGNSHTTLHLFPNPNKDRERFNIWVFSVMGDIIGSPTEEVYKLRRVCHAHFEEKYCCRYNRISNIAVPTLNLPNGAGYQFCCFFWYPREVSISGIYKVLCGGRCLSTVKLIGKTAVVTGCNTGIGKETVLDFYKRGAKIIMACRSVERAEEAKKDIENSCTNLPDVGKIVVVKLDLTSLKSVRECAQQILDSEPQINILVNNAGVMMCPKGETEDGFEIQFGTNHLAHFLLTMLLLPRIRNSTPARIVTVSSRAHSRNGLDLDDLNFKKRQYSASQAYSQSKLANVLFTRELAKRLKENNIEGVNTYSLHPGVIRTELGRHLNDTLFPGARQIIGGIIGPFMKSPQLGAQTTIYCAVDEKCKDETGLYYMDCVPVSPSRQATNDDIAKNLWDKSVELVGLGNFNPFNASDSGIKK